jgi:chemotaxis protein methyltransferase CheR
MNSSLPEITLMQLSEFITDNLALNFPKERWNDLERNIVAASNEFGFKDAEKFINHILSTPLDRTNIEILTAHLTNNETFFWREHASFEILEQVIIPELIQKRQKEKIIRIWSAGCSTGEEPYSIAIALDRVIPDIKDWNITILATDINPRVLNKAVSCEYTHWSFRGTPQWLKDKYFIETKDKKFGIIPKIKKMVKFDYLNLAEDVYPSTLNNTNAMDIIFCRNVLMYFTQNRFKQVVHSLYNSLKQESYLVVSASELSAQNFSGFKAINYPGAIIYQKTSKKSKHTNNVPVIKEEPKPIIFQFPIQPITTIVKEELPVTKVIDVNKTEIEILIKIKSTYEDALLLYTQGNYSEVIGKLKNVAKTIDELILLIRAYANRGSISDALETCEKAISANKLEPRLHYLYATILQESNKLQEAVDSLKRAIFLDSDFVLSYYSLGNIYHRMGKNKNARKYYEIVLLILNKCNQEEILPESEGLTAGRFKEIINASIQVGDLS